MAAKMLWSFYSNDNSKFKTRAEVLEYVANSTKPMKHTHGFGYRNPSINRRDIPLSTALHLVENECYVDVSEYDDYIHINTFSEMDMW